jgi:hypothetical protein
MEKNTLYTFGAVALLGAGAFLFFKNKKAKDETRGSGEGTGTGTGTSTTTGAGSGTGTGGTGTIDEPTGTNTGGTNTNTGGTNTNTGGGTAAPPTPYEQCMKAGGIWNGVVCNPCVDATHSIINGVCVDVQAQTRCETEQMGMWIFMPDGQQECRCPDKMAMDTNGICRPIVSEVAEVASQQQLDCENSGGTYDAITNVCTCPTGKDLVNGVCVTPTPTTPPTPTPTPKPTPTTTTTYIPPVIFPTSRGDGGSGGGAGGGSEEDKNKINEFDWIPYILAGITTALSIVSEQKEG